MMPGGGAPVLVMNQNTKQEKGRKAQIGNISAAHSVADIIRTTLGPRSMLKMIIDPMGGLVLTNDGNAILREIDVTHPAAKSMIELSRTQDEEVGDGTTSVIVLAGEILKLSEQFIERNMHPRVIVYAYVKALDTALGVLDKLALPIKLDDDKKMLELVRSCLGTKFVSRFGDLIPKLAIDAISKIVVDREDGKREVDIKHFVRVERIPGGYLDDSRVLNGIMLNKDVVHPKMSRKIENPRILLLDCPLEYKKGESQTNVEITADTDFAQLLKLEEDYIENMCNEIAKFKPNVVLTEKGVSDVAQHFLIKHGISCLRRLRKTDNDRIARAVGATIVSETSAIREEDIGKECGIFEIKKIGDDYFTYFEECKNPKACTVVLRGASKDVLSEIDRNLQDAMTAVRNIAMDPRILPGGGATELAVGEAIRTESKKIEGPQQWPFKVLADALEVIPKTLIENCGASVIRNMTALRAKHADGANPTWGIDGAKGVPADMMELNVFEPFTVKAQSLKTAVEAACLLLRIDQIHSGMSAKDKKAGGVGVSTQQMEEDTFGDARDG